MGILDTARDLVRSFAADFGQEPANQAIGDETFAIKARLIATVKAQAKDKGGRASLVDIEKAFREFGQNTDEGKALAAQGKWHPKSYANLNGQDLSGIAISEPSKQSGKRATTDLMDQDGDRAVNDFYTNISFFEANLNNCYVDPATSFNEEVAKAKHLDGLTFNGMKTGDTFTFGAGQYTNAKLTGVEGGEIVFSKGTKVDGIEFEGKCARVSLEEGASVEHIKGKNQFSTLRLDTKEGSRIANSDLTCINISGASTLKGCAFNNVQFGQSLKWLEFGEGCSLKNVSVNGRAIENPADLLKYGAESVHPSVTAEVSPEFRKQCAMDMIRRSERDLMKAGATLGGAEKAVADIKAGKGASIDYAAFNEGPATTQAPVTPAAAVAQGPTMEAPAATQITGGETVTINEIQISTQVAANVARTQPTPGEGMIPGRTS